MKHRTILSRRSLTIGLATAVVFSALTACSAEPPSDPSGETIELRYSSFLPENSVEARAMEWWFERVNELTDGAVEFERFYGGSLLAAEESIEGLQSGRADMVLIATNYHPAELPLTQLASVPFLSENGEASVRAFADLAEQDEALSAEYKKLGIVPITWMIVTNNTLGASSPVTTLDDLEGLSIRGAGMSADALDLIGVNTVALPAAQIYESIQQGAIDGFSGLPFANAVTAFRMEEVAPHFVDGGLGVYNAAIGGAVTTSTWESLPQHVREAMTQAAGEVIDFHAGILVSAGSGACDALKAAGGSVSRFSDADIDRWKSRTLDAVVGTWADRAASTGLDKATALEFRQAYEQLVDDYSQTVAYVDPLSACS